MAGADNSYGYDPLSDEEEFNITLPPVIEYIRNVLQDYPHGSQILKELIQNADDAGATEIEFMLDYNPHSTENLVEPGFSIYQGPALYAWNNAVFDNNDWTGIISPGRSNKKDSTLKVGKFGLGFVSVYHITDFPTILSNHLIGFINPQNSKKSGRLFRLEKLFNKQYYSGHISCFYDYFGYKGEPIYSGSIFRFPLRTFIEGFQSEVSHELFDIERVRLELFNPAKSEAENILLFLKNICSIKFSIKRGTETTQLYSVEISPEYREKLSHHRQSLVQFVKEQHYLTSLNFFLCIIPIVTRYEVNSISFNVWLVMNLIGLSNCSRLSTLNSIFARTKNEYLPWVGLALPTGIPLESIPIFSNPCFTLSWNGSKIEQLLEKLSSDLHHQTFLIPDTYSLNPEFGKIFCFLPTPCNSNFPFHFHGYLGLSSNRRSLKWPSRDGNTVESEWNKVLVETLGVSLCTALFYICIKHFKHADPEIYHYQLWSALSPHETDSSLFSILLKGILSQLVNHELVFSSQYRNGVWIKINEGIYISAVHEKTKRVTPKCIDFLKILDIPLVELPINIAIICKKYTFLSKVLEPNLLSPSKFRDILKKHNNNQQCLKFISDGTNALEFMQFIFSDFQWKQINQYHKQLQIHLDGIPLIMTIDEPTPKYIRPARENQLPYLLCKNDNLIDLFPGLSNRFINFELFLPFSDKLTKLANTRALNILDVSNITSHPSQFAHLLEESLTLYFNINYSSVIWKPNKENYPHKSWIPALWKTLEKFPQLQSSVSHLPLFPQNSLDDESVNLIKFGVYYCIEEDTQHSCRAIFHILSNVGCLSCYRHGFIPSYIYQDNVYPPPPVGFVQLLGNSSEEFFYSVAKCICNSSENIKSQLIDEICTLPPNSLKYGNFQCLPIFPNTRNQWSPLNTNSQILPPSDIPSGILYPITFLNPNYSNSMTILYSKLGVKHIDYDNFIRAYLLEYICEIASTHEIRNTLIMWILDLIKQHKLTQITCDFISRKQFLLDSCTDPNQNGPVILCTPCELLDPNDPILLHLPIQNISNLIPNPIYSDYYDDMKKYLFLKSCTTSLNRDIIIKLVLTSASNIASTCTSYSEWVKFICSLLKLLTIIYNTTKKKNNKSFFIELQSVNFIAPCPNKPKHFPTELHVFRKMSFITPSSVCICNEEESLLVASVANFFLLDDLESITTGLDLGTCLSIMQLLGCMSVTPELAVKQLTKIYTTQYAGQQDDYKSLHTTVYAIYRYLNYRITNQTVGILQKQTCILLPDSQCTFVHPSKVAFQTPFNLKPHIYELGSYIHGCENLFTALKICLNPTTEQLYSILHTLYTNSEGKYPLTPQEIDLALKILTYIVKEGYNTTGIIMYIPGNDSILYQADHECLVFCDENWLNKESFKGQLIFVHDTISNDSAAKLGVNPFSSKAGESINLPFELVGHNISITNKIRKTLNEYEGHINILKELLQNADDAGASEMSVVFDMRSHPSDLLLSEHMRSWQGPAILFYNNAVFNENDFVNIMKIEGQTKSQDSTKIGRFGLGFCTVYHITDVPSFVSRNHLHILDPQMKYIGKNASITPGIKIDFIHNKFVQSYKDQLFPYEGLFGIQLLDKKYFDGTLFRLPLRASNIESYLSDWTYSSNDEISKLKKTFCQNSDELLIFCQNVQKLTIYELDEGQDCINLKNCIMNVSKTMISKPFSAPFLIENLKILNQLQQDIRTSKILRNEEFKIEVQALDKTLESKQWLVCYATGDRETVQILSDLKEMNQKSSKLLPFAAIAFDLQLFNQIELLNKIDSKIFCFLPLSIGTKLPFHCNAMFELTSDRQTLFHACSSSLKTRWNDALVADPLAKAVSYLFEILSSRAENSNETSQIQSFTHILFSFFPAILLNDPMWKFLCVNSIANIINNSNIRFQVKSDLGIVWSTFLSSHFLHFQDFQQKLGNHFKDKLIPIMMDLLVLLKYKIAIVPNSVIANSGPLKLLFESTTIKYSNIIDFKMLSSCFFTNIKKLTTQQILSLLPILVSCYPDNKWLFSYISTVPCIPCGDTEELQLPSRVVDCNCELVSALYINDKERIPSSSSVPVMFVPYTSCYSNFIKYFGLLTNKLPISELEQRILYVSNLDNEQLAYKLIEYLDQKTFSKEEVLAIYDIAKDVPFVPSTVYNFDNNQFQDKLSSPLKVRAYAMRYLVGLQFTIAKSNVMNYTNFCQYFYIQKYYPDSTIVNEELCLSIEKSQFFMDNSDFVNKMIDIYDYLGDCLYRKYTWFVNKLPTNPVYIPNEGFVDTTRVLFNCEYDLAPYAFRLDSIYDIKLKNILQFFNHIKIRNILHFEQCQTILQELYHKFKHSESLPESEINIALFLIAYCSKVLNAYDNISQCYFLAADCKIHLVSECVFYDLKWNDEKGLYSQNFVVSDSKTYYFIHKNISNDIAVTLGVKPLSRVLLISTQFTALSFTYEQAGQYEDLPNRLRGILEDYGSEVDVFKELIQNADDAGASEIKFLFDYTSHPTQKLIHTNMEPWQGPSLYVYNDAVFTECDFQNIMKVAGRTKLNDTTKIGRFGLGFNTVYHITDVPSFVSRNIIQFFDPHCSFLLGYANTLKPGMRLDFTRNYESLKTFEDQFDVFNNIFDCNVFSSEEYNGTLFRLPFRTEISKISNRCFNSWQSIFKFHSHLLNIVDKAVIFLQNIRSIEVFELRDLSSKIKCVSKTRKSYIQRPYNTNFLTHYKEHFDSLIGGKDQPHVTSVENASVSTVDYAQGSNSLETYVICYASGTSKEILEYMQDPDSKDCLPLCSIAIPNEFISNLELTIEQCKRAFYLYCFLPLPEITFPLCYPMHINGYFLLNKSRRSLLNTTDKKGSNWNLSLINDALVNAVIEFLLYLTKTFEKDYFNVTVLSDKQLEKYYSFWPGVKSNYGNWGNFSQCVAVKAIKSNSNLFYCKLSSLKWLCYQEISFFEQRDAKITKEFYEFIFKFCYNIEVKFADIPQNLYDENNALRILLREANNDNKVYNFERVCKELIFPSLQEIANENLENLKMILESIYKAYTYQYWLQTLLINTPSIPCGTEDDFVLRIPSKVVCPFSELSRIFYPEDKRHPISLFYPLFDRESNSLYLPNIPPFFSVIQKTLSFEDLIDRCKIAHHLTEEDSIPHSMIIMELLNREYYDANDIQTLSDIPFIPVWTDDVFTLINYRTKVILAEPRRCFSFNTRFCISPEYYAVLQNICHYDKACEKLEILRSKDIDQLEMIREILLIFNSISFTEIDDKTNDLIKEQMIAIYSYLASRFEAYKDIINSFLSDFQWIWNPATKKFYSIQSVHNCSDKFPQLKSEYLVCFPYCDLLNAHINEVFFTEMGLTTDVSLDAALRIISNIKADYKDEKLHEKEVVLVLELFNKVICDIKTPIYSECTDFLLLSARDVLIPAAELYRNDITWMYSTFTEDDIEELVHEKIPLFITVNLGAKSKRIWGFERHGIKIDGFDQCQDIGIRIRELLREFRDNLSIFKEMIQNAEDAGASELAFIIDKSNYGTEKLWLPQETSPEWKDLQGPSLIVYNNKQFEESDFEGIQQVGVGGKKTFRSIGKFGIGFNVVYHLTDNPFIFSHNKEGAVTFCFFDPFQIHLKDSTRGMRMRLSKEKMSNYEDQFKPFSLAPILENELCQKFFSNVRNNENYTMFRLPFKSLHCEQLCKSNIQEFLLESSKMLLFLRHLQRIQVFEISEDKKIQILGDISVSPHQKTQIKNISCIKSEQCITSTTINQKCIVVEKLVGEEAPQPCKLESTWVCYEFNSSYNQAIEVLGNANYSESEENLIKYEKLTLFGGVAIETSHSQVSLKSTKNSLFCHLPIGTSHDNKELPVQINAPFILDPTRQYIYYNKSQSQEWEFIWHSYVIKNVLTPLYLEMLIDLCNNIFSCPLEGKEYYNWYYSLFPKVNIISQLTHNESFIYSLQNELYSALHEINAPILLSDKISSCDPQIFWHTLSGVNCGVFNDNLNKDVSSALLKTGYSITYAPYTIKESLACFEINVLSTSRSHIYEYISDNSSKLSTSGVFPCHLDDCVLSFEEIRVILEYLFDTTPDEMKTYKRIPLMVDFIGNLGYFTLSEEHPLFEPKYARLLPKCSSNFITANFEPKSSIIPILSQIGFLKPLDADFVSKNIFVESLTNDLYKLFWEFIISSNVPFSDLISKFSTHCMVPTHNYQDLSKIIFLPIRYLKNIAIESHLADLNPNLYSILCKLGCPFLFLEFITEEHTDLIHYLSNELITSDISCQVLLECIKLATKKNCEFTQEEASYLSSNLSTLNLNDPATKNHINFICNLKIFYSELGTLESIKLRSLIYLHDPNDRFPISYELAQLLLVRYSITVFAITNNYSFLSHLCSCSGVKCIDTTALISFICKIITEVDFSDLKQLLLFSHNHNLLEKFRNLPFILTSNGGYLPPNQLYVSTKPFFRSTMQDKLLLAKWENDAQLVYILQMLGLNTEVTIETIVNVANKIAYGDITDDKIMLHTLNCLIDILPREPSEEDGMLHSRLVELSSIPFLKVTITQYIPNDKIKYEEKLGTFSSAQLNIFKTVCCTTCWIHCDNCDNIPERWRPVLGILEAPPTENVVDHLKNLVAFCGDGRSYTKFPNISYFHDTYLRLNLVDDLVDFSSLFNTECIMYNNKLFGPISMTLELSNDLSPYLFQVPSELIPFSHFLVRIGVEDKPTCIHLSNVLELILVETKNNLSSCNAEVKNKAILAFDMLFKCLREQIPGTNIRVPVLTDDMRILSSDEVIYADNTQLLNIVRLCSTSIVALNILRAIKPNEVGLCSPPTCLNIQSLTSKFNQSLPLNYLKYRLFDQSAANLYLNKLKSPYVHRGLIRIFYHHTQQNLALIKWKDNKMILHTDDPNLYTEDNGYHDIFQILNSINVISCSQIDIELNCDDFPNPLTVPRAFNCYLNQGNSLLIKFDNTDADCIASLSIDIAYTLNTHFCNIFSDILVYFQVCLLFSPAKIMDKLNEFNISMCPFIDCIPLPPPAPVISPAPVIPQTPTVITPAPTVITPAPTVITPGATTPTSVTIYDLPYLYRAAGTPAGPDVYAAKIWIKTAQWDLQAAKALLGDLPEQQFPSHSCFLCFEAVFKAFIAVMYLKGRQTKVGIELRNLQFIIDNELPECQVFTRDLLDEILICTIPLMNLDEPTRLPCSTPGVGRLIPREHFVIHTAMTSITRVNRIFDIIFQQIHEFSGIRMQTRDFQCATIQNSLVEDEIFVELPASPTRQVIDPHEETFYTVARHFFLTLPHCKIISIEKIQNRVSWNKFRHEVSQAPQERLNVKPLFHGSSGTHPDDIITSDVGFDNRYSQNRLWGPGIYFAVNSSYSDRYAHWFPNGEKCIFLAQVFIGASCHLEQDNTLRRPPDNYDSVEGEINGCTIYILYSNSLAYPSFLITYRD